MNEVMSKAGSQVILKTLLNIEVDMDSLPMGPELNIPIGTETVVLAETVPYRAKEAAFDNNAIKGRVAVAVAVEGEGGGEGEGKGSGDGAKTGDSGTTDGGGGFEHWLADSI
jgi:DEAD/DEAH box helicase domain-containing protein